jgi:Plant specific mitochondrial import receptor subunit TOM20
VKPTGVTAFSVGFTHPTKSFTIARKVRETHRHHRVQGMGKHEEGESYPTSTFSLTSKKDFDEKSDLTGWVIPKCWVDSDLCVA